MAHLIDKDALVAEIEKQMKSELGYGYTTEQRVVADAGKNLALRNLLFFLDTLEVKDVDLEKEIQNYITLHNLHIKDGDRIVFENGDSPNFMCDIRNIAKHFFELGMAVGNKAQKGEK